MRIGILTHFRTFQPGYALHVGWLERVKMMIKFGEDVDVLIQINAEESANIFPNAKRVLIQSKGKKPFLEHVAIYEQNYLEVLQDYDIIITSDIVLQKNYDFLCYHQAVRNVIPKLKARWFHWIHSSWNEPELSRLPFPFNIRYEPLERSTMVYMNYSERWGVSKMYKMSHDDVACVWNPKDFRSFNDFDPLSWEITDMLDIPNKDVVQIYPHSASRMSAKGIDTLIKVFGNLRGKGLGVALILAQSSGKSNKVIEMTELRKKQLEELGLKDKKDFIFTTDITPNRGPLSRKIVSDLFKVSNLFVFPSWKEVSPNVLLEAKISGNLLAISEGIAGAREFGGPKAIYFKSTYKAPGVADGQPDDIVEIEVDYDKLTKQIMKRLPSRKHLWEFSYENIWHKQMKQVLYRHEKKFIAGMAAISWSTVSPMCMEDLAKHVDYLLFWFDLPKDKGGAGDEDILKECVEWAEKHTEVHVIRSKVKWDQASWREVMIRHFDDIKPDFIINLDSDEILPPEFYEEDLERFIHLPNPTMLLVRPEMLTEDGRDVNLNPKMAHCKVIKWMPGIHYKTRGYKYLGFAQPHFPLSPKVDRKNCYRAKHPFLHLCYYTKEQEKLHKENRAWRGI
jgi:glycosyltransferase involved in cell wall biosynthesis